MKKFICILSIICLLAICLCGCDMGNTQQTNNNDNNIQETEEIPTETTLTVNNISNYLIFTTDVEDVELWENEYVDYPNPDTRGTASFRVKTSSKQNVEFNNVNVKFKVIATGGTVGYGWDSVYRGGVDGEVPFEGTLSIPYNGVWDESFKIKSEYKNYVSDRPNLEIKIISVSGTVTSK